MIPRSENHVTSTFLLSSYNILKIQIINAMERNVDEQAKICPIQPDGTHRTPKFRSGLDQQLQSAIPFVKRAEPVKIYNKDGIIASIMTGDCEVMDLVKFVGSYS